MRIKALARLEPPGLKRPVLRGEEVDVEDWYATRVLNTGLAKAVAVRPVERAEKRPKADAEKR